MYGNTAESNDLFLEASMNYRCNGLTQMHLDCFTVFVPKIRFTYPNGCEASCCSCHARRNVGGRIIGCNWIEEGNGELMVF